MQIRDTDCDVRLIRRSVLSEVGRSQFFRLSAANSTLVALTQRWRELRRAPAVAPELATRT